jgi:hypothetical protein
MINLGKGISKIIARADSVDGTYYTNVRLSVRPFYMSRSNLRTPWPIHFKLRTVIGIDSLMVCILFGEI